MSVNPTGIQNETLAFIREYIKKHGFSPKQDTGAAHFDITQQSFYERLKALAKKGLIEKAGNGYRPVEQEKLG